MLHIYGTYPFGFINPITVDIFMGTGNPDIYFYSAHCMYEKLGPFKRLYLLSICTFLWPLRMLHKKPLKFNHRYSWPWLKKEATIFKNIIFPS